MDRKAKKETTPQKKKMIVDCLKITEDKSSENRVQTSDTRLIISTTAAPRREGRNPRLSITAVAHYSTKTRGSKPASLLFHNDQDAEPEACVSHEAWSRTWSSHFNQMQSSSVTLVAKREAQSPHFNYKGNLHLGYNCPHYWVSYCLRNKRVYPHYGVF